MRLPSFVRGRSQRKGREAYWTLFAEDLFSLTTEYNIVRGLSSSTIKRLICLGCFPQQAIGSLVLAILGANLQRVVHPSPETVRYAEFGLNLERVVEVFFKQ